MYLSPFLCILLYFLSIFLSSLSLFLSYYLSPACQISLLLPNVTWSSSSSFRFCSSISARSLFLCSRSLTSRSAYGNHLLRRGTDGRAVLLIETAALFEKPKVIRLVILPKISSHGRSMFLWHRFRLGKDDNK